MTPRSAVLALSLLPALAACRAPGGDRDLSARLAKFAPVEIRADDSKLPASEREALAHLVAAAQYMQAIFLRQAWEGNVAWDRELEGDAKELFRIHVGAWDRTDEEPFVGDLPRPEGAGYYPPDMTKEEFEAWIAAHPEDADAFRGLFTVIRRTAGGLEAIPYSKYYAEWLKPAAEHLRAAAAATKNESLRTFLLSRAEAFGTDDYYRSDMDWMDLDSLVEITIGPYETYEDRLFGYKAAFEAFVTLKDPAESERLSVYKNQLPAMEANLPIPDAMKNPNRGTDSPIGVVDVVYTGGDTRAGVQTIAYNLPNDERVREAKGSKKVLLRNVIMAKYEGILKPIAAELLRADQVGLVSAWAFSNHTLFHELSHGLGPGRITVDGRETEVRLELKELYSPLEEAKADIMGQYNLLFMMKKGIVPAERKQTVFVTWLASLFRSIRFGTEEAHGKANAIQFNYMLEKGAITRDADGKYAIDFERFPSATRDLVHEICVLQANGDYEGTERFFEHYAELSETMRADLQRLEHIPVDIRPMYEAD